MTFKTAAELAVKKVKEKEIIINNYLCNNRRRQNKHCHKNNFVFSNRFLLLLDLDLIPAKTNWEISRKFRAAFKNCQEKTRQITTFLHKHWRIKAISFFPIIFYSFWTSTWSQLKEIEKLLRTNYLKSKLCKQDWKGFQS